MTNIGASRWSSGGVAQQASPLPRQAAQDWVDRRPLLFRRSVLTMVTVGSLPPALLLFLGKAVLAGRLFWALFFAMAIGLALRRKSDELLCLLLGLAPLMNLLRGFAFYNIVTVVLFLGLLFSYVRSPEVARELPRRFRLVAPLFIFTVVYYAVSFVLTGDYSVNLRFFELSFGAVTLLLLGRRPAILGAALMGMMISAIAVGIAMLPHLSTSERLGMVEIQGFLLGNPVQLGLPLALSFLALAVDRGAWLGLTKRWHRIFFLLTTFVLLLLTTSRAAWLIVAFAVPIVLLLGRRQRAPMFLLIGLGLFCWRLILLTPYRDGVLKGLERTFSEERSTASKTSGRSDQWLVTGRALGATAGSLLHGYGPGRGPQIYARYSPEVKGVSYAVGEEVALHSLYMQVAVETGLLGLGLLIAGLVTALVGILGWTWERRLLFPLVSFFGYVLVALTVSGNDTVSASFLGVGLLATLRKPHTRAALLGTTREARAFLRGQGANA